MVTNRRIYYRQVMQEIEDSQVQSSYLLFGEEYLLGENVINKIKEKFLAKVEPELNFFVRYASEDGVDKAISLGAGAGLFSEKKIIVLRDAHFIKQTEIERLIKFINKKATEICLILQTNRPSLYQTKLSKLENYITSVHLLPLRTDELMQFVKKEFENANKEVTQPAIEMLLFLVGFQMSDLILQINNIAQFFTDRKTIDTSEVEQVAAVYVTQDIFEYNRQLALGNFDKSVFILSNLLESGVSPQQIVSQLFRYFTILWRIKGYYRSGIRAANTISRELKIYSKYFQEYGEQSKSWKYSAIINVLKLLSFADKELKSSTSEPKIMLDMLSKQIINSK